MKTNVKRILGMSVLVVIVFTTGIQAQDKKTSNASKAYVKGDTIRWIDDQRMTRDMEVAKNVLGTLIKQQFEKRIFFPINVEGDYVAGYGATFRLSGFYGSLSFALQSGDPVVVVNGITTTRTQSSISYSNDKDSEIRITGGRASEPRNAGVKTLNAKKSEITTDSIRNEYSDHIIEASKDFIADYGDLISQMTPDEKIVVTNQDNNQNYLFNNFNKSKRSYISIEASKGDINLFRQGKLSREQLMNKIKVVNSEAMLELDSDLELFSSILSRLYQQDLSKTYFVDRGSMLNYERLKDFGVIYYMQMRSSNQTDIDHHSIPTLQLKDIDQKTRDAKVKGLYPQFEKEIKENLLDYGRTLKSLKDEEVLVVNVKMTKCDACQIPSYLELSVKESVLKDYNSGKLTKEAALTKVNIKKGANQ